MHFLDFKSQCLSDGYLDEFNLFYIYVEKISSFKYHVLLTREYKTFRPCIWGKQFRGISPV